MSAEMTIPPPQELRSGGFSSFNVIGEVTEAVHKLLLDTYDLSDQPPRIEEDLKFVPKDREEVIYIYMYRTSQNDALMNQKRLRLAPVEIDTDDELSKRVFYHRPPLLMDLFYLVCVHSKFRSDAERLMGWVLMTLHYTPKLIYRPRRFVLPDGTSIDSMGRPYDPTADTNEARLQVEKVSLALVDDLTVGDAINLYTLHEAPYRPYLTYRARVALDGPLYSTEGGSLVSMGDDEGIRPTPPPGRAKESPTGRIRAGQPPPKMSTPPGPKAHNMRRRFQRNNPSETED
ncbi:MAG: DUF4255 domain-containing protein [Alphaproteobacteria bacterium]|nr:DUF4255 domain-containing protein [Alphaproteobacteria bacterium]